MPNRVRIVANHPNFGTVKNEYAYRIIEQTWHEKFRYSVPVVNKNWPRWKKILWMAKGVEGWKIKVLREPKRSKASKSLYGKWLIQWGLKIPPLRKKNKKGPVGKKLVINGRSYGFAGGLLVDPIPLRAQGPVQPIPVDWEVQPPIPQPGANNWGVNRGPAVVAGNPPRDMNIDIEYAGDIRYLAEDEGLI